MSLIDPGVVPELGDPAFGRPVGGPSVHETVYNDQADHGVRVPVHYLDGVKIIASVTVIPWLG